LTGKFRQNIKKPIKIITASLLALTMAFTAAAVPAVYADTTTLNRPVISARSAVVIDGETGSILYGKNIHSRRDPVSTTKLLTTLIAVERLDLNQVVTISRKTADTTKYSGGSRVGLKAGENITVRDLLYGALLPSGNDAAEALAVAISGSDANFAVLMNEKAQELGCQDSSFSNPYGWKVPNHYSSAYDMALIARAALNNDTIETVCSTERYRMHATNKQPARTIYTSNSFVAGKVYTQSGVFAGKTGTWSYGNSSLVSACQRNGRVVYSVVLGDTIYKRYSSTNSILDYSYSLLALTGDSDND